MKQRTVDGVTYNVVGDWTTLVKGDLYLGERSRGPVIAICESVKWQDREPGNPNFPEDNGDHSNWVVGRSIVNGEVVYPYDLHEVSKVERA